MGLLRLGDPALLRRNLRRLADHAARRRAHGHVRARGRRPLLRLDVLLRLHPEAAARDRRLLRAARLPGAAQRRRGHERQGDPEGLARRRARHHPLRRDGHPRRRRRVDADARGHHGRAVLRARSAWLCSSTVAGPSASRSSWPTDRRREPAFARRAVRRRERGPPASDHRRIRGIPALRARPVPDRGVPRARGGPERARRRADRRGQDDRRRVRRAPRHAGGRRQGLLHDADQGALEPEVPRAAGRLRRRERRAS